MRTSWRWIGVPLRGCGFMWIDVLMRVLLLILLGASAYQDWRTREVSNWISLPVFLAGFVGILIRRDALLAVLFVLLVGLAMIKGGYGPADGKLMAGLTGLWPTAALASVLLMPIFDLLWRKKSETPAPLTISIAAAALLTSLVEGVTMFADNRATHGILFRILPDGIPCVALFV